MYKIVEVSSNTSVLCRSAPALLRLSVLRQLAGCAAHLSQAGLHAYCILLRRCRIRARATVRETTVGRQTFKLLAHLGLRTDLGSRFSRRTQTPFQAPWLQAPDRSCRDPALGCGRGRPRRGSSCRASGCASWRAAISRAAILQRAGLKDTESASRYHQIKSAIDVWIVESLFASCNHPSSNGNRVRRSRPSSCHSF